ISRLCNGNLTSRIMSVPAALRTDGRSGLRHRSLVELQSLKLILEATSSAGHCKQSKRAAGAVGISLLSGADNRPAPQGFGAVRWRQSGSWRRQVDELTDVGRGYSSRRQHRLMECSWSGQSDTSERAANTTENLQLRCHQRCRLRLAGRLDAFQLANAAGSLTQSNSVGVNLG
uniref:Kinesin motor domain-containing protein n=1 Tax=Macrostomum lignano TaxID=282301 RepID=A0A1I8JJZ1_9PLAT